MRTNRHPQLMRCTQSHPSRAVIGWVAATCLGLAVIGCKATEESGNSSSQFGGIQQDYDVLQLLIDLPIPAETTLDNEQSLILGRGENWTGRLVLYLNFDLTQAISLYQREMGNYGWKQVLTIQDDRGQFFFTNDKFALEMIIQKYGRKRTVVRVTKSFAQSEPAVPVQ